MKEKRPMPEAILLDEPIGWIENGCLRQYHEGQMITNPDDIQTLIGHGAIYFEVQQP